MAGAYTPVLEADLDEEIQLATYISNLNAILVDVEGAYWTLALAQEELVGTLRSLGRAQKQLEDTEENIRRGLLAEAEGAHAAELAPRGLAREQVARRDDLAITETSRPEQCDIKTGRITVNGLINA